MSATQRGLRALISGRGTIVQGLRFISSGMMLFPLGLATSAFCHEILGWSEYRAGLAAIVVLFIANFLMARAFVFASRGALGREFAKFISVAAVMRGIEYLMYLGLLRFVGLPYIVAMAASLAISSAFKFVIYRHWVFAGPRSPAGR